MKTPLEELNPKATLLREMHLEAHPANVTEIVPFTLHHVAAVTDLDQEIGTGSVPESATLGTQETTKTGLTTSTESVSVIVTGTGPGSVSGRGSETVKETGRGKENASTLNLQNILAAASTDQAQTKYPRAELPFCLNFWNFELFYFYFLITFNMCINHGSM